MKQYLDNLREVLDNSHDVRNNRTGIPDIGIGYGVTFVHDMSNGFPLVTTKKMGLKNIATELEFFIKGYTDKKWLQDRNCHIWDEWANPMVVQTKYDIAVAKEQPQTQQQEIDIKNKIMDTETDLGPIYGWQWRHFGSQYHYNPSDVTDNYDKSNPGVDQVKNAIYKLKNNPNDRRILVNAWNPVDMPQMALPPCHVMHQLIVRDGKLNLIWTQRSCDMFLGIPYNIASYALLLLLYAKEANLKPGVLKGELHDAHIYTNHIDQVKTQLTRKPYPLPTVEIPDKNWNGMLNWKATDFNLKNYICHERIKGAVAR